MGNFFAWIVRTYILHVHTYIGKRLLYTVEPPNKGHYGANVFVPCREVVPMYNLRGSISMHGVETRVLCREVVPISEGPLSDVPLYTVYRVV